ncbi:aldehyde dehydrogenase (NADP(+)) [Amnibacterium sp.]|uniref:aldehyde dehydrogenase (NADP(+)) n=1 Tax=Amnibacterium sp. TaxID=1872496 RepID=UPI002623C240|nr:aldehyde dehydrogenase (NADP(+)) [Amnibacterium sp.]MCU1472810.1 aldehyde dehydrogenase [Amnibacterium sp.]
MTDSTRRIGTPVVDSGGATMHDRIERAHHAFELSRRATPADRQRWLEAIADGLDADAEELITLARHESRLPEARLRGELIRTAFQLRLLGAEAKRGEPLDPTIDHADRDWGMGPRPDIRRVNQPLGVVAVFGASNFPFAFSVIGGDSAAALAAGCSVVHKAHSAHPRLARRTAETVIEALRLARAPDGLFALVSGFRIGEALVEHPLVQAVAFTGSTRGGRALFDRIAGRPQPIPFFGELGSTNPVFVAPAAWAARREEIVRGFLASVTGSVGQLCTKPGFLIVPRDPSIAAPLTSAGADLTAGEMLTPHLRDAFRTSVADFHRLPASRVLLDAQSRLDDAEAATLFAITAEALLAEPEILQREMFGPASVVVEYSHPGQLIELAKAVDGQLTAGIHADAEDDVHDLARVLAEKAGRLVWNAWPTGVTVSYAQQHGGPYPATTASGTTSVGTGAVRRFLRPVAYQGFPETELPEPLRESNPWGLRRRIDGEWVDP